MSDEGDDGDEFLLYDAGVLPRLQQDRDFFKRAIIQFYVRTAEAYGCSISLSERRIDEVHDFWIDDVERALKHSAHHTTTELDHFKNAAYLAFWLRRLVPINDINFCEDQLEPGEEGDVGPRPRDSQVHFYRYGNELCALFTGFYICLAYEVYGMFRRLNREKHAHVVSDAIGVRNMPAHFRSEFPKLLKHKPISPQAMYMLYRSLFDTMEWEPKGRRTAARSVALGS